jgi:uncharacterized protein (TIGR03118 family)
VYIRLFTRLRLVTVPILVMTILMLVLPVIANAHEGSFYEQTNLVSNIPGMAKFTDKNLKNPWGIAFGPKTPFWVADNGAGVATMYKGNGTLQPLVVTIPPPKGQTSPAAPTGIVFNSTDDFVVSKNGKSGPAVFIFATEDGTLSGWNPKVDRTNAILEVNNPDTNTGPVYKGLASGRDKGDDLLFAANFRFGRVDVFNSKFKQVSHFTDHNVPSGFAPFGIRNINGLLYVTFAKQDDAKHDDVAGAGNGFVDVFNTDGHLIKHLISRGALNSPWGLALAPSDFGRFSHALLVGNFGDSTINAFNPRNGDFLGTLKDKDGNPLGRGSNPVGSKGLWGLTFGNGRQAGDRDTLFFTAGINDEADGLFGAIEPENSNQ